VIGSLSHSVGSIFQPIFRAFGWLLAFFYGLIPNYAIAIVLLTIVIMGLLTPFTIKSTKSMAAMQRLQPEIKKLQVKYKGPENRALLNEELMRLYKEENANPIGGCLPVLLQAPFLFMLYSVIKGLANKVLTKGPHPHLKSLPRYIPVHSKMYTDLIHSGGQIKAFGMDLNLKLFSAHSSWLTQIPFVIFVLAAVGLQYFQMAQINNRNAKMGTKMPAQQLAMQRFLPLLFAFFYMAIPAAVVLYMIISTTIRIITQMLMYRAGLMDPHRGVQKKLPSGPDETVVAETPAIEAPKPAPAKSKSPQSQPTKRPAPKPTAYKPQPQSRSKAKRKRKAR
jgi:YidC/Oxa1 family membrane protein insertase